MPQKKRYDETTKYLVANIHKREIFLSEFLFAKNRGYISDLQSHNELDIAYFKLLPFILSNASIYQNNDNYRFIYVIDLDNDGRKILHIVDDRDLIVSIYIMRKKNFEKQLKNGRFNLVNQFGGTASPLTLWEMISPLVQPGSCPKTFWRQTDLLEKLYHELKQKSINR